MTACSDEGRRPDTGEVPEIAEPPVAEPARTAPKTPAIGETAPDFTLTDHTDNSVTLSAARGEKVLLVFYRGHW